ncbi:hypothetical protein AGR7A_pAt10005 [Agrobacterium deltaense NCPPB 1641]|uniref:Uncharacterized protein n=1 Tax=Agrobacterium deltaense NCPPB 1641 TaxID=1183425 RepID=A0A1S7U6N9_9HYPH|nr:hypothetical protein AGR7A_pAt10005 [Agrobacterium deltaense NCPPB 1641]
MGRENLQRVAAATHMDGLLLTGEAEAGQRIPQTNSYLGGEDQCRPLHQISRNYILTMRGKRFRPWRNARP